MKTVVIRVSGEAAPGDLLILYGRSPKGGQCSLKAVMVQRTLHQRDDDTTTKFEIGAETIDVAIPRAENVIDALRFIADDVNGGKEFLQGQFTAKLNGEKLVIYCNDLVSDVEVGLDIEGTGTLKAETEVI